MMAFSSIPNGLLEPHLNADGYRMAESNDTQRAPIHCDFITLHAGNMLSIKANKYINHFDGAALVGSSNYTERYWTGAVTAGDSVDDVRTEMSLERSGSCSQKDSTRRATVHLQTCVTAGCYFKDPNKIVVTEEAGSISVWSRSDGGDWGTLWSKRLEAEEHDGAVSALDCLQPDQLYVTVGEDANIKIWDMSDLMCKKTYRFNESMIHDVSVEINSTAVFATASMDGAISLWDLNCDKRAKVVARGACAARCVRWLDERRLLAADEAGALVLLDVRSERRPLASASLRAPAHRLAVQHSTERVGVCCDARTVAVYGCGAGETLSPLFAEGAAHSDLVRGLAWDPRQADLLHAVSWDGRLLTHHVASLDK